MKFHLLKTHPEFFQLVKQEIKTFEIRKNDRDYGVEDILFLEEYDPVEEIYTGEWLSRKVTYILDRQPFVPEGYVAMAIKKV